MTIENATYINQLNPALPPQTDFVREGAGHLRMFKGAVKATFPNVSGAVTASHIQLSYVTGVTSAIQPQIDGKGAIAGQTWTGTHVFPNATTIGPLTPTIQGYLATVTGDVQAQINGKGAIAGQVWQGPHDYRSATLLAPTRTTGDATQNVATTAFVAATALAATLPGQTGNAGRFITTDGANATWQWPQLTTVVHTVGGVLQIGKLNILNCTGQTFTLPATFQDGDTFGFVHVSRTSENSLDWDTRNLFGRKPGLMALIGDNVRGYVRWDAATGGFV